jgi:hypothetical protein
MKKLSMVCFLGLASLAAEARVCYVATAQVPSSVPREICLTNLNVNDSSGNVGLSFLQKPVQNKVLRIVQFSRHNEERAHFVAQTDLVTPWEATCFRGEHAELFFEGSTDTRLTPEVNFASLKVWVNFIGQRDVCHNPESETKIGYALSHTR